MTGWAQLAFGLDWSRPPRQMIGTAYWYLHTDQWRYDGYDAGALTSGLGNGTLAGRHTADLIAQSARMGWMPTMPTFDRNPLDVADEALAANPDNPAAAVADALREGRLGFAGEDPTRRQNWPRVLTVWRANLLGSSGQGQRVLPAPPAGHGRVAAGHRDAARARPEEVRWHDEAPEGKLDLLLRLDFRMTSTTLFSDIVLPAATWYEKHDLSSTDMHPFVHAFNPAIAPPWQTRTDFDAFHAIAAAFSGLAADALASARTSSRCR